MSTGRNGGKAKEEESARGGARALGWFDPQRGQKARKQTKRPQGWPGQKPQEGHGGAPQCTPTASWASEELVNRVMMLIRARYGELAIGRGDGGIRYCAVVQ
jgi:hypothetical protein